MNPINIVCPGCGIDILIEPEVYDDDEATCGMCGGWLWPELMCTEEELCEQFGIKGDYE